MPAAELIPELIAIAKEHNTSDATKLIKALFAHHDVHIAKVHNWTQDEMDAIKNDGAPKVTARKREPGSYATDYPSGAQDEFPEPHMSENLENRLFIDGMPVVKADDDALAHAMRNLSLENFFDPDTGASFQAPKGKRK